MKDQLSPEMMEAIKEVPYALFESKDLIRFIAMVSSSLICIFYLENINIPVLLLPISSVIMQTVSTILDAQSTINAFKSIEKADSMGIRHTIFEQSKVLGQHPKSTEITSNKISLFIDAANIVLSGALPPYGIGHSIGRSLVILSNRRKTNRLNRAIALKN